MIQLKPLIFLFTGASLLLIIYMLIILIIKNYKRKLYKRWTLLCNNIVNNNVVYSDEEHLNHNKKKIERLMLVKSFRKIITQQILLASKSFSGKSINSLQKFYLQLDLDKYVTENLKSQNWHIRAKAIQEIGVMKLTHLHEQVLINTNHKNDLVRAEAQIAIIKLIGFDGLKFLNTATEPISEWYQMILQRELSSFDYNSFEGIDLWLKSKNKTVVVFALKLIDEYHLFELYENVSQCLKHDCEDIRKQAIRTITEIFNKTTSGLLISMYEAETYKNKIEIARVLQSIGTESDIPFLINQLDKDNTTLNIIITRTLAKINIDNFNKISKELETKSEEMGLIVAQIKEEINI